MLSTYDVRMPSYGWFFTTVTLLIDCQDVFLERSLMRALGGNLSDANFHPTDFPSHRCSAHSTGYRYPRGLSDYRNREKTAIASQCWLDAFPGRPVRTK